MPVTRRQFQLDVSADIEEWMKRIHSFLVEHWDEAFTAGELSRDVPLRRGELMEEFERSIFSRALTRLVASGHVERKMVDGKDYFAARSKNL